MIVHGADGAGLSTPAPAAGRSAPRPAESIAALLLGLLDHAADRPAICAALDGGHTWRWGDVVAAAAGLAAELAAAGVARGERLAHLGPHSADWVVVDLACALAGIVHCGLHADAAAAEHDEVLGWLAPRAVVLSGPAAASGPPRGPWLTIDLRAGAGRPAGLLPPPAGRGDPAALPGAALRAEVARLVAACDPDACGTILLSSGTTGRPKGVLHCQRALAANAAAAADVFLDDDADVRLSWLPMSHAMARTGDLYTALVRGGCLCVVGDRRRTLDACRMLPPTVVLGVPAFFERLERAAESGRIPDLAAALGGRVRVCVSGGAPLRRRTAAAFAARGVPLVEGYGLAEAGPVIALSNPRNARPGTVGPPLAGVELRLDDRPETGGQLLVRTPCRAIGVLPATVSPAAATAAEMLPAAATAAEAMAGWLETGDLAVIDDDGHLVITGRVVDTIVLAGGTKVPPAEVEAALAEDAAVAQVCVVGQGLAAPMALVVPEPTVLRRALRRMGVRVFSRRAALAHPRVLRWLARRLARRQRHLPRAWRIRRAVLVGRPFDPLRGETTASLKLRRPAIAAAFAAEVSAADAARPPAWVAEVPCGRESTASLAAGGAVAAEGPAAAATGWLAESLWHGGRAAAVAGDDAAVPRGSGVPPGFAVPAGCAVPPGFAVPSGFAVPPGFAVPAGFAVPPGFAVAGCARAEPLRDAVADVVVRAAATLARLRTDGTLYDPATAPAAPRAPLADAPGPTAGRLSRLAEEALADTGLFGLLVPQAWGGSGATLLELVRAVSRLAAVVPTAAGLLAVHSAIGAVASITAFGSDEQRRRHLPALARGRPLSIFGATEPDAGCDLHAVAARLERRDGRLVLSGTKMFITGATHGRLVKLLALHDGRPTVVLVRLPDADTPEFRLRHYALHPLRHAHNAALEFTGFAVDEADVLDPGPPAGGRAADGMRIVWHGLNRGRVTLAAQAAGTLRLLAAQARDHALARSTWGRPIASRELVQGRLGRIAAGAVACDALAAWAAAAIDAGHPGELEAIAAKVIAGECVRAAAVDALGVHGGRAFLVGHPLGDSFHDHFAVTVYEGESELLGLAMFKGLCRHHPLAGKGDRGRDRQRPAARAAAWLAWRAGQIVRAAATPDRGLLDGRLREHAATARRGLARAAVRIDRGIRRHGRDLAERQLLAGAWSAEVRELVGVLAVAHHADWSGDDDTLLAADCWCRLALARAGCRRLGAADHAAVALLGRAVVDRGPPASGDEPA